MTAVLIQTKESDGLPLHTRRDLLSNIDCCMENSRTFLQSTEDKVAYSGILEGHTTTFATFYDRHDLHTAAEELFLESVRFQNNDASTVLRTMNNLGALCIEMSKTREAEHVLGLVLAAKELTLGRDHFSTLNTVNNLGNVFTAQLLFDKATEMYQRALAGYRKTFRNAHHSTIHAYNNPAELAMKRGDFQRANGLLDSVLDAAKACNREDSDLVIYIESNLALVAKLQGRLAESVELYKRSIEVRKARLGAEHSSTLRFLCELVDVLRDMGDTKLAGQYYDEGKATPERRLRCQGSASTGSPTDEGSASSPAPSSVRAKTVDQDFAFQVEWDPA